MLTGAVRPAASAASRTWPGAAARWADCSIGLLLFVCGALWSTHYWNQSTTGRLPFFYESYFEPAVMVACGKGFVVAQPQVPAMAEFLAQEVDRFSCDAIPADVTIGTHGLYQGAWRYLMYTVGFAWRILGVSWSGMGPLFGTLFAVTVVALYAVFRLGMGPPLALLCTLALAGSRLHLAYLPFLRDYAKAPFTLILIFLLGLLVSRRPGWKGVLAVSAAYGTVLGIGYGFRTDLLANIPPFYLTLFGFLDGGLLKNLRLKAASALMCAALFVVTGWPIISAVRRGGGCQWHAALLGLSANFSDPLNLTEPPYQLSRQYLDEFVYTTVTSSAARLQPGVGHIEYCWPEYDSATGRYLMDLVTRFPADMIVRAYSSILRIVELPVSWRRALPGEVETSVSGEHAPHHESGAGLVLVVVAIGLVTAASVRLGLFLLIFLLYFGGYPALQFNARHYFHLEFITWWAAGFITHVGVGGAWSYIRERRWSPWPPLRLGRAVVLLMACAAVLVLMLWTARAYQQVAARALLRGYVAAAREEIPLTNEPGTPQPVTRTAPGTDPETADFLEVDLNEWRCGDNPAVTFRYDRARRDFSRTFVALRQASVHEPTRIFVPVYDGFQALELSDTRPGCVDGAYRVHPSRQVSLLLEAVLPPRWETSPLYQRFRSVWPG